MSRARDLADRVLHNRTHEDTEGGRESIVTFKGEQSGGEISTLAQIQASHDGTSDDEKADLIFKTNDGSDGASPTTRMVIDSAGDVGIGAASSYGRLSIFDDNSDIAMDANGSGQLHIDGNGYGFGVALNADGAQIYTNSASRDIIFGTNETERMRITDGDVGIGTSSPSLGSSGKGLHLKGPSGNSTVLKIDSTTTSQEAQLQLTVDGTDKFRIAADNSTNLKFVHSGIAERMRIDSSGNLMVNGTVSNPAFSNTANQISLRGDVGTVEASRDGGACLQLNRGSSNGDIAIFRTGGTTIGQVGSVASDLFICSGTAGHNGLRMHVDGILPTDHNGNINNNDADLGHISYKFDDIYAHNGTIQTSDERQKQQIASLTNAEMTAAKAISKLFKTFKWNDSVAEKGDSARTHTGVIAQQVEQAMTDAGLDIGKYAFFTDSTCWEFKTQYPAVEAVEAKDAVYDDDGNLVSEAVEGVEGRDAYEQIDFASTKEDAPEGATELNVKGIRYPELLAFIGAATEQRLTSIESRLDALEAE